MNTRLTDAHAAANPEQIPSNEDEPVTLPLRTVQALVSIAETAKADRYSLVRSELTTLDEVTEPN